MNGPALVTPTRLADAIDLLASTEQARPLAGGTDLMLNLRLGTTNPPLIVDLMQIERLSGVRSGAGELIIGATTTMQQILTNPTAQQQAPALLEAADRLGGRQMQAIATLGGNLCNASPAAETATPLFALDASAVANGPNGPRRVPISEFLTGPGETTLAPGEILTAVAIPPLPPRTASAYSRLDLRRSVDIAIVSCSVSVTANASGTITAARIALGAVGPTPLLATGAADNLIGSSVVRGDPATAAIAAAAAACERLAAPIDDVRASARYRRAMTSTIVARTIRRALMQLVA